MYVADDAAGDIGSMTRFCLAITTMTPIDNSNRTAITIPAGAPGVSHRAVEPLPFDHRRCRRDRHAESGDGDAQPPHHTRPQDLDILLTGPAGGNVLLMSDVGGVNPGVSGRAYTFDDAAASSVPVAVNPPSGTYRPTNDNAGGADALPAPRPRDPTARPSPAWPG